MTIEEQEITILEDLLLYALCRGDRVWSLLQNNLRSDDDDDDDENDSYVTFFFKGTYRLSVNRGRSL